MATVDYFLAIQFFEFLLDWKVCLKESLEEDCCYLMAGFFSFGWSIMLAHSTKSCANTVVRIGKRMSRVFVCVHKHG